MSKRIMLHICCAPCATAVVEKLREDDFDVQGFFYNPSIHPWKEFQRRLNTLETWASECNLPVDFFREYPLEDNVRLLLEAENRCLSCFLDRMKMTASEAAGSGFDCFTTTLTVSPYQNQELIKRAAMEAAENFGVEYLHFDFRDLYKRSIELSREAGLYRQPYCGCVFSERDRYLKIKSPGELYPQNGY